jgi:hypothetical protein
MGAGHRIEVVGEEDGIDGVFPAVDPDAAAVAAIGCAASIRTTFCRLKVAY